MPEKGKYGTGLVFMPKDKEAQQAIMSIMIEEIERESMTLMHVRSVPVNSNVLGKDALATEPDVKQIFITAEADEQFLEKKLYIIRKKIENRIETQRLLYSITLQPEHGIQRYAYFHSVARVLCRSDTTLFYQCPSLGTFTFQYQYFPYMELGTTIPYDGTQW